MSAWADIARRAAPMAAPVAAPSPAPAPVDPAVAAARALFLEAVGAVFARWTLLLLAVEQGWGDGDPRAAAAELLERTRAKFTGGAASGALRAVHEEELEDLFHSFVDERFHAICEDGSPEEVAALLVSLARECAGGDVARAHALVEGARAAVAAGTLAAAAQRSVAAPDPDAMGDDDDDDELEPVIEDCGREEEDDDMADAPSSATPAVDPDGWSMVTRAKSRAAR